MVRLDTNSLGLVSHSAKPEYSIDLCETCDDAQRQAVIANYKPMKCIGRYYPNGVSCDLTGSIIKGSAKLYYMVVNEVDVDIKGDPATRENPRRYEFMMAEPAYTSLRSRIETLRDTEAVKWS